MGSKASSFSCWYSFKARSWFLGHILSMLSQAEHTSLKSSILKEAYVLVFEGTRVSYAFQIFLVGFCMRWFLKGHMC